MPEKVIVKKPPRSPFLAGLLAAFFPGAGALYNREYQKGILFIIIGAVLITLQARGADQPFAALILGGFYIFQIIEAAQTAKSINLKAETGEESDPWEDFSGQVRSGSIFWGLVIMALGALFLMANFEWLLTYNDIFRFWPLAFVVIGGKMVWDFFARKK